MTQWDSNQICLISKIQVFLITRNKARPINRAKVPGSKLQTPDLADKADQDYTRRLLSSSQNHWAGWRMTPEIPRQRPCLIVPQSSSREEQPPPQPAGPLDTGLTSLLQMC